MNTRNYGGVIWTDHALERLRERKIRQRDAYVAFTKPDQSRYAQSQGGWVYYKTLNGNTIEVVAKQNEKKEWIILTVWSKPVYGYQSKKQHWLIRAIRFLFFGR